MNRLTHTHSHTHIHCFTLRQLLLTLWRRWVVIEAVKAASTLWWHCASFANLLLPSFLSCFRVRDSARCSSRDSCGTFQHCFFFNTCEFFSRLCCPFAASVVVASSTTSDLQRPDNTHFVWSVGNANSCCCTAWCCCALLTVCCCGAVCCGCGYCCRLSIGQLQVAACVSAYEISQQLLSELHSYR